MKHVLPLDVQSAPKQKTCKKQKHRTYAESAQGKDCGRHEPHHIFNGDKIDSPQEIDADNNKQGLEAGICHWLSSGNRSDARRALLWIPVFA